jgi:hypothetical protein
MHIQHGKSIVVPKCYENETNGSHESVERGGDKGIKNKYLAVSTHQRSHKRTTQSNLTSNDKLLGKKNPDATFDKVKARVLTRGDKQVYTGVSELNHSSCC